jgi:hypothetical protein
MYDFGTYPSFPFILPRHQNSSYGIIYLILKINFNIHLYLFICFLLSFYHQFQNLTRLDSSLCKRI